MSEIRTKLIKNNEEIKFETIKTNFPSKASRIYKQYLESYKTRSILKGGNLVEITDKSFSYTKNSIAYVVELELTDFVDGTYVPTERKFFVRYKNQEGRKIIYKVVAFLKTKEFKILKKEPEIIKFQNTDNLEKQLFEIFLKKTSKGDIGIKELFYGSEGDWVFYNRKGVIVEHLSKNKKIQVKICRNNKILKVLKGVYNPNNNSFTIKSGFTIKGENVLKDEISLSGSDEFKKEIQESIKSLATEIYCKHFNIDKVDIIVSEDA